MFILVGQLGAGPVDRHLGEGVKVAGGFVERRLLIVVSLHHRAFQFLDDLHALVRIGVVADDISKADELGAIAFARVGQDGLGRFEICMEVAKNGDAHDNKSGSRRP